MEKRVMQFRTTFSSFFKTQKKYFQMRNLHDVEVYD